MLVVFGIAFLCPRAEVVIRGVERDVEVPLGIRRIDSAPVFGHNGVGLLESPMFAFIPAAVVTLVVHLLNLPQSIFFVEVPAPFGSSSIIYAISVFQFLRLLSALVT